MAANTYPDPRVTRFMNDNVIPVQFNVKENEEIPDRFHAHWTPAIMYIDPDFREFRRSFGSLNPDQFLAEFSLAHALRYYHTAQFEKSVELFEKALQYTASDPLRHSENLYWIAAARYESPSGTVDDLQNGWNELRKLYPDNDWTKKSNQLKID